MNEQLLPDIPRLYTAIAEWLACLIYILPLKKRVQGAGLYALLGLGLAVQCGIQLLAGFIHPFLWVEMMLLSFASMLWLVFVTCEMKLRSACYLAVRAFIFAEFAASFEWQLYCYMTTNGMEGGRSVSMLFLAAGYMSLYMIMFFVERRHLPLEDTLSVAKKDVFGAAFLGVGVFTMSNISFVLPNSPFSSGNSAAIYYIRTLVDFAGIMMLYTQLEQKRESDLRRELQAMDNILHRQYDQYRMSKDNDELIGRKYHDLKHQIAMIRAEADPDKREKHLREMDAAIKQNEAENRTDNPVLDTILFGKALYCSEHNINLTCVADGALLSFIEVMDLCTIFGNALDNAIESVEKIADTEKRLISLSVSAQNEFVMIRCENYFEDQLILGEDLPHTTKKDARYHGYGLKSIRATLEKYAGSLSIRAEDHWFSLHILIPRPACNTNTKMPFGTE